TDRSAGRHRPDGFDPSITDTVDLVDHVAHHAAVVWNDVHHVTDDRSLATGREVHDTVLLGQVRDGRLRIFDHVTVALDRVLIGREHLGAGIDDGPCGRRTAHDRGAHAHGAMVPGGRAGGHDHHVVEDVGPGAVLGEHRNVLGAEQARRATAGDDGDRDAGALE